MAGEKSRYSLFAPTPDRLLRGMTTDRPDMTESPFTVDAGRVQVETNLFGYARWHADEAGAVTEAFEFGATNVRIGLTSSAEINLVWQPHGRTLTRWPGVTALNDSGIGGLEIRGKVNLWGNDTFEKDGWALAMLPFVTLPTDRDNGISPEFVEGGLIVPLAVALPNGFGFGINGGVVWVQGDELSGYHREYLVTAALSYEWTDKIGSYYEIAATFTTGDPREEAVILATGITYAVTDNLQLDAGLNFGVTRAADRFNPFIGLAQRF